MRPSMPMSEKDIWKAIQAGDDRAWRELVDRYQSLVYSVALKVGLSMSDAADCFQHTWLALFRHRNKIRDPRKVAGWLAVTARREAVRVFRQSTNQESVSEYDQGDDMLLPDEELELLERQAHLQNGLARLDERCQHLLRLFFFAPEDFSYDQIASKMGISANSLGPIRQRCLERLRKILTSK